MADSFDRYDTEGGGGFMMGLLTGAILGAGLGMLLAPKAGTELRGALGEQARNLGNKASEQYKRANESATVWAEKGREFVDKAREAATRGAEEVRSYAGTVAGGNTHSGTGTSGSSFGTGTGPTSSSYSGPAGSTSGDFNRS